MNNRVMLQDLAQKTIEISKNGKYQIGNRIYNFETENKTEIFKDCDFDRIKSCIELKEKFLNTQIEIKNEGTVDAVFRLSKDSDKNMSLGILNFASAYNPGGGFESGAMAQEECLAYCSDLYLKQVNGKGYEYYEKNRANRNPLYSDNMLMSNVTFFRNSRFSLVGNHIMCNVLTSPAVNMGIVRDRGGDVDKARNIMKNRMRKILYLFAYYNCTNIVLGAFGCGVFGNSPDDVAKYWYELLYEENLKSYFEYISFSILDKPGRISNIDVFKNYF